MGASPHHFTSILSRLAAFANLYSSKRLVSDLWKVHVVQSIALQFRQRQSRESRKASKGFAGRRIPDVAGKPRYNDNEINVVVKVSTLEQTTYNLST